MRPAWVLALALGACGDAAASVAELKIEATPVPLSSSSPAPTRVGELIYAGGLALSSPASARFGGLSGLEACNPDPTIMYAVSDTGDFLQFDLRLDERGRLVGVGEGLIARLREHGTEPLEGKRNADAEGLSEHDGCGSFMVSFERGHRVHHVGEPFDLSVTDGAMAAPAEAARLPENEGLEALASFEGVEGSFLVGSEGGRLWRCRVACSELKISGRPGLGWGLTALDQLAGQRFVALYRFYNPLTRETRAAVALLTVSDGGAQLAPLAQLSAPLTVDNMEGIAALPRGDGWRLYLISDDNFSPRQRTLLLAFDWVPPPSALPGEGRGPERVPARTSPNGR